MDIHPIWPSVTCKCLRCPQKDLVRDYPLSIQRRQIRLGCAQVDLSLHWVHKPFCQRECLLLKRNYIPIDYHKYVILYFVYGITCKWKTEWINANNFQWHFSHPYTNMQIISKYWFLSGMYLHNWLKHSSTYMKKVNDVTGWLTLTTGISKYFVWSLGLRVKDSQSPVYYAKRYINTTFLRGR